LIAVYKVLRSKLTQVYTTEHAVHLFVIQCLATCGEGVQYRNVSCSREGFCDEQLKPLDRRLCDAGPCLEWVTDSWGQVHSLIFCSAASALSRCRYLVSFLERKRPAIIHDISSWVR